MACRGALIDLASIMLERYRLLCLVSPYETAWYDFVTVALRNMGIERVPVLTVNFATYVSTKNIIADAFSIFGEELDQFCVRINDSASPIIILTNLEAGIDADFHEEAYATAEYIQKNCHKAKLIVIFAQPPSLLCPQLITMHPLTEGQCVNYIRQHPLGGYATEHEIRSGSIFLYTDGLPEAIDKLLRIKQHDDLIEIYLNGLRATKKTDYYPEYLRNVIDNLKAEDESAFELLVVLTLFPMGESIHSIRYINPKKKLNSRSAIRLEDLGLVTAKILTSEALNAPEPYKIVSVHRLIREYIADNYLSTKGKFDYEFYLASAVSLYFGPNWKNKEYKLSGNFLSDKLRLGMVMAGNARFILVTLLSRADDEAIDSPDQILSVIDLVFFYVAKLNSTLNFRHVTDLLGDISDRLDRYGHLLAVQEIRHCYMNAFRMQSDHDQSLEQYSKIGIVSSQSLNYRVQIELAYCKIAADLNEDALKIANYIKNSNCDVSGKLHGRFINILAADPFNKLPKLEKLAKDARARGVFSLSNHVKAYLIKRTGSKEQRINMLRLAAITAQNDGDSLNFIRNSVDLAEYVTDLGNELTSSDISHLVDCYHFAHVQRSTKLFTRIHNLLWSASRAAADFDRMLELYIRASSLTQILNFEINEKSALVHLINTLPREFEIVNDKRLIYILHRAVELQLVNKDSLPSVLMENTTNFLLENSDPK